MIWKKTLPGLSLAAAAAVLASACGDGGTTGGGGAGGTGSASSSNAASSSSKAASSSSTTSSSSSTATSTSSGGMMGACNNPDDLMKLMDQNVDKMNAQACGMMCIASPNQAMCAGDCMKMKMMISDGCAKCWGDTIACGIMMCLTECLMSPMACDMCTAAKCEPAFHTCAGI